MEDEQMPKQLLCAKTSGRQNVGRSGSRGLGEVDTDAKRMGIRMWWRKALDRKYWRKVLMKLRLCLSCRAGDNGDGIEKRKISNGNYASCEQ
jgi:CRISPR/Cas system CSM-associated protein Csm3 (group 7 of RAMP superfamily)